MHAPGSFSGEYLIPRNASGRSSLPAFAASSLSPELSASCWQMQAEDEKNLPPGRHCGCHRIDGRALHSVGGANHLAAGKIRTPGHKPRHLQLEAPMSSKTWRAPLGRSPSYRKVVTVHQAQSDTRVTHPTDVTSAHLLRIAASIGNDTYRLCLYCAKNLFHIV